MANPYEFTETERDRYAHAKKIMAEVKGARRERIEEVQRKLKEEREKQVQRSREILKEARDNKIRAALLEVTKVVKTYGMKFDAPGPGAGYRWATRQPFVKLHVTDVHGVTQIVQIYIKHDGFEWD